MDVENADCSNVEGDNYHNIEALHEEIAALKDRLENAETTANALAGKLADARRALGSQNEENARLAGELEKERAEANEALVRLHDFSNSMESLRSALTSMFDATLGGSKRIRLPSR